MAWLKMESNEVEPPLNALKSESVLLADVSELLLLMGLVPLIIGNPPWLLLHIA
jgi:hypothetical protein